VIRAGQLSALGGLAVLAIFLVFTTLLGWLGASFGEALYLSVCGLVVAGYGLAEWQLRRK
jgi:hypothetical protein